MATVSGHTKLTKGKRGGVWFIKFRYPSGKQEQERLGPAWTERTKIPPGYFNKKDAEAALQTKLTDIRRGEVPDPGHSTGKTFGDATAEYLRYVETDRALKASTLRDYGSVIKSTLLPEFGSDTSLDELTEERFEDYRARLLMDGKLSRRTIQKHIVLLNGIFKRAKVCKWIAINPMEGVEPVKLARSYEFNVLDTTQVAAVARKAEPLFAAAIIVSAYTGLRAGELRGLRWRDVDFASGTIRIQRNLPAGGVEGSPKSGKVRSTPLDENSATELEALSRRARCTESDDFVFCNELGVPLGEDALRRALYAALKAAGIDRKSFPARGGFTWHDLRHTFGTLAVQVPGNTITDVQAFMGHSNITTTMKYVHHVPKSDAAARFSAFIRQQNGELAGNDSGTLVEDATTKTRVLQEV